MKLKKLWIPALLLGLIGGAAKICDTLFNVGGSGFIFSSLICNWILAGCVILLFLIGFALSLADRKKTFHAEPVKSIACGLFGFLASVMLIGGSVIELLSSDHSGLVENIFAIIAGIVLLYESCISFTGQNGMKKIPLAALLLPIWCCVRFIGMFASYSQKSLKAMELFDIIALAFLLMFLFYQGMFFAGINNRLAIRKSTLYGVCYIMLGLIVVADLFIKMTYTHDASSNIDTQVVEPTINHIIRYAGDLAFCGYAFFFVKDLMKLSAASLKEEPEEEEQPLVPAVRSKDAAAQNELSDSDSAAEKPEDVKDDKNDGTSLSDAQESEDTVKTPRDDSKKIAEQLEKANAEARIRAEARAKAIAAAKAKREAETAAWAKAEKAREEAESAAKARTEKTQAETAAAQAAVEKATVEKATVDTDAAAAAKAKAEAQARARAKARAKAKAEKAKAEKAKAEKVKAEAEAAAQAKAEEEAKARAKALREEKARAAAEADAKAKADAQKRMRAAQKEERTGSSILPDLPQTADPARLSRDDTDDAYEELVRMLDEL